MDEKKRVQLANVKYLDWQDRLKELFGVKVSFSTNFIYASGGTEQVAKSINNRRVLEIDWFMDYED